MAVHAHSTTAPARPLLPLASRPSAPVDDPRTPAELLTEIAAEIERQAQSELPPEPLLSCAVLAHSGEILGADLFPETGENPSNFELPDFGDLKAASPLLPLPAPLPSLTAALSRRRAIFGAVAVDVPHGGAPICATVAKTPVEPDTAAEARAIHARRELHGALEWGFAFLDAFDLGPAALDVVDGAIARMDAMDGDTDLEPYLSGYYNGAVDPTGEAEGVNEDGTDLDAGEDDGLILGEADSADDEPHLGSAAGDGDQRHWNQGDHRDVEAVNEGGAGQYDPNWTERQPQGVCAMYDDMRALSRRAQAMKRRGAAPTPEPVRIWTPTGICNLLNVDGTPAVWAVEPMVSHV